MNNPIMLALKGPARFMAILLVATVVSVVGCTTSHIGRYTLSSKKRAASYNHEATALIFTNEKGERYIKRVFVDTFIIGRCYEFKR